MLGRNVQQLLGIIININIIIIISNGYYDKICLCLKAMMIVYLMKQLTNSWLTELENSLPHSQGLSNNPYPEPNQTNSSH